VTIQTASRAPIGIQRRMMEVGRIRFGDVVAGREGKKPYPRALDKFRLTSASRAVLEAAAAIYGAAKPVREWKDAPNPGMWELYTDSAELDIILPPVSSSLDGSATYPYSQAWELWDGPTCARRCDGETAMVPKGRGLVEVACLCDPERRGQPGSCEIRTRISVMLPQLPGLGLWRMDTGGMNAAAYLPGTLQLLAMAAARGRYLPCKLRLEHRSSKRPNDKGEIETHRFVVPVLDPGITPGELMAMTGPETMNVPQIGNGDKPQLPAPAERPAQPLEKPTGDLGPRTPLPSSAPLSAPDEDQPPDPHAAPADGDPWMKAIHAIGREKGLDHDGIRHVAAGFFGEAVFPADRSLTDLNPLERGKLRKALDDMKPANEQAVEARQNVSAAVDASGDSPDAGASAEPIGPAPDAPIQQLAPAASSPPGDDVARADTADPDPAIEKALWEVSVAHRLIAADAGVAGWDVIDALAERVFAKDRGVILRSELTELAAQIAAGVHDPTPARPRRATAPKEST
jgi:hypothetical protein